MVPAKDLVFILKFGEKFCGYTKSDSPTRGRKSGIFQRFLKIVIKKQDWVQENQGVRKNYQK